MRAAFDRPDEARLVAALHAAGDVRVALLAERDGIPVGHVLLSAMTAPLRALALAPLSVIPAAQRAGVGHALVTAAIAAARDGGWQAIFLLGDPAYYARFGFSVEAARHYRSPYAGPAFQVLVLDTAVPASGRVEYAPAFAEL